MSIDRLGSARQAEQAADVRKAEEKDKAKTKSFDSVLKGGKKDTEKSERAKGDKKADDAKKKGGEELGMMDQILGREMRERIEGRGEGGEGGEGSGEGGEGGEGSEELGKLEGEAKETLGKLEKAEGAGKGEKAEGAEKGEKFEKVLSKKTGESEDAKKADQAKDLEQAKRTDKPGEAETAKVAEKDDSKSLQEQLAANMAVPGQVPHPFLASQVQEVQAAQQAAPVIPPEIVDKIVQNARFGMNAEGAHEFQVDLKQDVYAGLKMKIATKDGKVSVSFVAENAEVAAQFEAKAAQVTKQLTDRGLNVTSVNVMTRDQDAAQGQSKGKGQQDRGIGGVSGGGRAARSGTPNIAPDSSVDRGRRSGKDYTA